MTTLKQYDIEMKEQYGKRWSLFKIAAPLITIMAILLFPFSLSGGIIKEIKVHDDYYVVSCFRDKSSSDSSPYRINFSNGSSSLSLSAMRNNCTSWVGARGQVYTFGRFLAGFESGDTAYLEKEKVINILRLIVVLLWISGIALFAAPLDRLYRKRRTT